MLILVRLLTTKKRKQKMSKHNLAPSQSEINSQFDDIMSAETWSDELYNPTQLETYDSSEIDSPSEVVTKQTDRIVTTIDEMIPNTNVADRQRFIAKLDRKRNEAFVESFNFDKDVIKQNEATIATFNFDKDTIQSDEFEPVTAESEDTSESDDSEEILRYSKKTAKALDWVAEKIDNKNEDSAVSDKLYNAANFIDDESKTTVAKTVLKYIGKIGLDSLRTDVSSIKSLSALSADKIRTGIDKLDERSRENDGWLSDKIKKSYNDAKERRATRRTKNLQDKAYNSYESNLVYTQTDTIAQAQAMNEQNDAFASYEDNVAYTQSHEDALVDNEAFTAAQDEAKANAEAAAAAKERRSLRRQKLKESGKEVLLATKDRVSNGRIGRATARATQTAKTYHQSGRAGVANANTIRNSSQTDYDLAA